MASIKILDGHVAHERLDDEVVVINLETGAYYALDGASADCWTLLSRRLPVAAAADLIAERYGVDDRVVRDDVGALAAELVREGLAAWDSGEAQEVNGTGVLPTACAPRYDCLRIEKYDDMEELLLLDPIHEVDAAGWPALPAESV